MDRQIRDHTNAYLNTCLHQKCACWPPSPESRDCKVQNWCDDESWILTMHHEYPWCSMSTHDCILEYHAHIRNISMIILFGKIWLWYIVIKYTKVFWGNPGRKGHIWASILVLRVDLNSLECDWAIWRSKNCVVGKCRRKSLAFATPTHPGAET